jgi:hypothetical protein
LLANLVHQIELADDTSGGKDITANDALTGTADPNATVKISEGSTVLGASDKKLPGLSSGRTGSHKNEFSSISVAG